jgi:hypothetical protein
MPWVGFKPTIPTTERAKTFDALDRAATVLGARCSSLQQRARKSSSYHACRANGSSLSVVTLVLNYTN